MSDKFKAVGSAVYIPGGGFDVRYCPEPKKLAARIARECNYHERLAEMVGELLANPRDSFTVHMAESLLAALEADKGGEL